MKSKMKEYRAKSNMKQIELAKSVGVARETITRIENGYCNPSLRLAMAIAKVLGTTVNELFYIDDIEKGGC